MEPKKKNPVGRPPKKKLEDSSDVVIEPKAPLVMNDQSKNKGSNSPLSVGDVKASLSSLFQNILGYTDISLNKKGDNGGGILNLNYYNPFLQNERLKLISASPIPYSPEEILAALKSPQYHEEMLQESSASLSASQYLYYKILREAADIPLFKYFVVPPVLDKEEYQKKAFKDEEEFVDEWLRTFDVVNTLKRVSLEVKREGKPTYLLRQSLEEKDGKKTPCYVTWQKLPPRYVKLTAIGEHGYIASFNLMIFLQPAFSPKQYPPFIQNIWNEMINGSIIIRDSKTKELKPDLNKLKNFQYLSEKGEKTKGTVEISDKRYMYWVQLPQDMCFTFASDTSNAWSVPDTIGLFSALQELTDYSTLAGLVASTPLTAVLTGQAEFVKDAQIGQDQTCMSPHTMQAFSNTFDSMVSGNIASFLAPFKDLKLQSLPNVPNSSDIKTKAVQNFVSSAGEGGLISATDKPSVSMVKGAQLQAASQYDFVTKQFQTILNENLKKTGLKYKWRIVIWGDIFTFDNHVKVMKEMVAGGASFLLPKLVSAFDLSMRDLRGLGEYMEAFEIYDKFKPLNFASMQMRNASTTTDTSEGSNPVGRPTIDDADVENDSTAASKDAGDNVSDTKEFSIHEGTCILCGAFTEEGHIMCEDCEDQYDLEGE